MGRGWGWRVDTAGLEEMHFEDLFCYRLFCFCFFFKKHLFIWLNLPLPSSEENVTNTNLLAKMSLPSK